VRDGLTPEFNEVVQIWGPTTLVVKGENQSYAGEKHEDHTYEGLTGDGGFDPNKIRAWEKKSSQTSVDQDGHGGWDEGLIISCVNLGGKVAGQGDMTRR